ncbi:uncharacterized protein [Asterias amurensis]|uniref:uncharacterized protein isoform X3 n=1 Tax=Asterias amurensis TaxID=7602 RepID=UPI003AB86DD8
MPSNHHTPEDSWINLRPYDPNRQVANWSSRHYNGRDPYNGNEHRGEQHNHGYERDNDPKNDPSYTRPYYIYGGGEERRPHEDRQAERKSETNGNLYRPKQRQHAQSSSRHSSQSTHIPIQKSNSRSYACMAITLLTVLAFILLGALAVFLVFYIIENNSTTVAPTVGVTSQAPAAGVVSVGLSMKLMQPFLPEYNDVLSAGYIELSNNFTNSMNEIFTMSDLSSSYMETNVNNFSPGSIDVDASITFTEQILTDVMQTVTANPSGTTSASLSIQTLIQMSVESTIVMAVEEGTCCQDLAINTTTITAMEVILPTTPLVTQTPPVSDTMTPGVTTNPEVDKPTTLSPSTTPQPAMLNPPECGISSRSAPSTPVTPVGTWPWHGSVNFRTGHACGCTLIGEQWAVTSAGCIGDGGTLSSLVFGDITSSYSQSSIHVERTVETIRIHPGYNRVTLDNDIAFLKLAEPVIVSNDVWPVCFQQDQQTGTPENYKNCYIAGWGTLGGVLNENLMTSPVLSVTDGICPGSTLSINLMDKFICAQFTAPDACLGDSGAGLMCQNETTNAWNLVGIIDSTSTDCSEGTFTKVAGYYDIASSIIDTGSDIPCETIQVPQCTSVLSYSTTHPTSQSAIASHMATAESSGLLSCHSQASVVLCAALMPECQADGTGLTICQAMCFEVSTACTALFQQLSLVLDCRSYPLSLDASSVLCQTGEDYSCGNRSLTLPALYDYTTLSSPNFPNLYPGLDDCVWIISTPHNTRIIIKFLTVKIEGCCDTLTIGEGNDERNRTSTLAAVFGMTAPKPLVIESSSMWLRFQSDSSEQLRGFQAEVQAIGTTGLASYCSQNSVSRCSDGTSCIPFRWRCDDVMDCPQGEDEDCQILHEEITLGVDGSQQILSPRYSTGSYISNSNATWVIRSQPGRKLLINFDTFSTELDFDIFSVGDGGIPNDLSTLFFVWSGKLMPPVVVSNSNLMWISFESDGSVDTGGFDFTVFDVDNAVTFDCEADQFDCGHLVCVPDTWQCDGEPRCADWSDEANCVEITASGSMTLLTLFTSDLGNLTSPESVQLSTRFVNSIDPVLSNGLGTAYVSTTVDAFRSSTDPVTRTAADTAVDFTVKLNRYPSTAQTPGEVQTLIDNTLTTEVQDGSLGFLQVNSTSVVIHMVFVPTTAPSTSVPNICLVSEFSCDQSTCIPQSSVCNQVADCLDGTDEVFGQHNCPVACGDSYIALTSQGSVDLTVPMVATNNNPLYDQQCGYIITAPANHRVYLVVQKINLVPGQQHLVLSFGQGKLLEFMGSVEQPLDIVSVDESISISLYGSHWNESHGISFQISATQQTGVPVCDNGVQVLPADKKCDQRYDCVDYSDEFNCASTCGQTNHTLSYNTSVTLQLNNFPSNYANNMACLWLITGLPDTSIIFDANVINIMAPDSLSFGHGHDPGVRLSAVAQLPGILPTGSHILVVGQYAYMRFISDSMGTDGGFSVGVTVLNENDYVTCSNNIQAVFQDEMCDGVAQCVGSPSDEVDCNLCQEIPAGECASLLPYTMTKLPGRYSNNVTHALSLYQQNKPSFCNAMTEIVLCSLLFPECNTPGNSRQAICRGVCNTALVGCDISAVSCDSLPSTGGDVWCNYDGDVLETGYCGTRAASVPISRIVNGDDASLGTWPWILSILDETYTHRCGATLINNQWAITAAHCMDIINYAVAGFTNLASAEEGFQFRDVSEVYNHPFYDPATNENDISVIKLESPINFTDNIRPACLQTLENETLVYDKCYISGWGTLTENGMTPDILQEARIPLVPKAECTQSLQGIFTITDNMICAGYKAGGIDSCQGDSGGPLVCEDAEGRWNLVGATSFGYGCARPDKPGVYARISQYIDFITFHVMGGNG